MFITSQCSTGQTSVKAEIVSTDTFFITPQILYEKEDYKESNFEGVRLWQLRKQVKSRLKLMEE